MIDRYSRVPDPTALQSPPLTMGRSGGGGSGDGVERPDRGPEGPDLAASHPPELAHDHWRRSGTGDEGAQKRKRMERGQ
jgi:hypothetical protein